MTTEAEPLRAEMTKRRWRSDGEWLIAPREDGEGWIGESRFHVGLMNAPDLADAHNRALVKVAEAALAHGRSKP